jgi:hypothetical protein
VSSEKTTTRGEPTGAQAQAGSALAGSRRPTTPKTPETGVLESHLRIEGMDFVKDLNDFFGPAPFVKLYGVEGTLIVTTPKQLLPDDALIKELRRRKKLAIGGKRSFCKISQSASSPDHLIADAGNAGDDYVIGLLTRMDTSQGTKKAEIVASTLWEYGAKHILTGEITMGGYQFVSDPNDPLVFVVVHDKGYVHLQGRGTVRDSNGNTQVLSGGPHLTLGRTVRGEKGMTMQLPSEPAGVVIGVPVNLEQ